MNFVEKKLEMMGILLPQENHPAGEYLTFKKVGNLVFVSGQTCKVNGKLAFSGRVGADYTLNQAQEAAKICAINVLVQLKHACSGNLDAVKNCVKLTVFVNAALDYLDHAQVSNGASNVMIAAFGENGRHARTTIGAGSLPGQSLVEVDGIFEVEA
jgi:enamine deaminase RidA (YjgF/YER057c/UK114 family)